jgi:hypothetical protein
MNQKGQIRMVITVHKEIYPELYELLSPLAPRLRAGRLRNLAETTLMRPHTLAVANTANDTAAQGQAKAAAGYAETGILPSEIGKLLAGLG